MSLIVDSSVWIDGFNPKAKNREKDALKKLIQDDYPVFLCPIIYQEVLQGIREDSTYEKVKNVLRQFRMINIDLMLVTERAIELYRYLRKKGVAIRKSVDCLIASYAIITNFPILHNDSDFSLIAKESKLKIYKV